MGSNDKVLVYNNIDGIDYFTGTMSLIGDIAQFVYSEEWLNNPLAFALNFELPLDRDVHYSSSTFGNFQFVLYRLTKNLDFYNEYLLYYLSKKNYIENSLINFEDLLIWFRDRKFDGPKFININDKVNIIPFLINLSMQNDYTRCGSYRYKINNDNNFVMNCSKNLITSVNQIDDSIEIFDKIHKDNSTELDLECLLAFASGLSGYQPKINLFDENNNLCIAKISNLLLDNENELKREILALNLAKKFNIELQDFSVKQTQSNLKYLLLKRFDRQKEKRIPLIYFRDFAEKFYKYADDTSISQVICNVTKSNKTKNLREFFKRKLFRTAVNNTKDHLSNVAFLFDKESGWNLSPEFDTTVGMYRYSSQEEIKNKYEYNVDMVKVKIRNLIENSGIYSTSEREALEILMNLKDVLSTWQKEAINVGFSEQELIKLQIYEQALEI